MLRIPRRRFMVPDADVYYSGGGNLLRPFCGMEESEAYHCRDAVQFRTICSGCSVNGRPSIAI